MQPTRNIRKLLIVINYYDGDHQQAADLCSLITDLETVRCQNADIALYRRSDARIMEDDVRNKLLSRFNKVHQIKCRRLNAVGYPAGPNAMFYDLLELMRKHEWKDDYYAFVNVEADCVPLRPGWINALSKEFMTASQEGYLAVGHMNSQPIIHLNGAGIYATDFFEKAGGLDLLGGPENVAYDFHQAGRIVPVSKDTPLMLLDFNRPTIAAEELFAAKKSGQSPFFYHGVKDSSAILAVRSKWIDKDTVIQDLSNKTICTYFEVKPDANSEQGKALEEWKAAWISQGWNVVVNTLAHANKHPRYNDAKALINANPDKVPATIMKWLAFEVNGGGVYADATVMPTLGFTPDTFYRETPFTVHQTKVRNQNKLTASFVSASRESAAQFVEAILVSDMKKATESFSEELLKLPFVKSVNTVAEPNAVNAKDATVINYSKDALMAYSPGSPLSYALRKHNDGLFI